MARAKQPTEGELEILDVLWTLGKAPARDVHAALAKRRQVSESTVKTLMQIMLDKGLIEIVDARRPAIYKPTTDRQKTVGTMIENLLNRFGGGSLRSLILHAASGKRLTKSQVGAMEKLLDDLEKK